MPQGTETVAEHRSGMDRRTLIKAAGAAGVAAWSAPVIYGSLASPAAAQQSSCTAITRIATGALATGDNGSITITLPASTNEDIVLVGVAAVVAASNTITWGSSFTQVPGANIVNNDVNGTQDLQFAVGYRVSNGSLPASVTVTWSGGTGVDRIVGAAVTYRCAKIGNLFDPANAATGVDDGNDNPNAPDVTTGFNGSMVLSWAATDEENALTFQTARSFGLVMSGGGYDSGGEAMSLGMGERLVATAGSVDGPQWDTGTGDTTDYAMITMGLRLATT